MSDIMLRGDGPPDAEKIGEIASRYGLSYEVGWIPELVRKYNLNPPGGS